MLVLLYRGEPDHDVDAIQSQARAGPGAVLNTVMNREVRRLLQREGATLKHFSLSEDDMGRHIRGNVLTGTNTAITTFPVLIHRSVTHVVRAYTMAQVFDREEVDELQLASEIETRFVA